MFISKSPVVLTHALQRARKSKQVVHKSLTKLQTVYTILHTLSQLDKNLQYFKIGLFFHTS